MKNVLMFLSALIAVVPAWAADEAAAPTTTRVDIVLNGPAKGVSAMVAGLEKDAAYKAAECSRKPAKRSGKMAKVTCSKADGALMAALLNNAAANVHWNVSGTAPHVLSATVACKVMACPPPTGPNQCCTTTYPYKSCSTC